MPVPFEPQLAPRFRLAAALRGHALVSLVHGGGSAARARAVDGGGARLATDAALACDDARARALARTASVLDAVHPLVPHPSLPAAPPAIGPKM